MDQEREQWLITAADIDSGPLPGVDRAPAPRFDDCSSGTAVEQGLVFSELAVHCCFNSRIEGEGCLCWV